ncbi:MAG: glycogen/starch/alpha-glucan phosphorylase, partial [Firmicutes bacterium]|nr:glycogen/starch/alpha-glucan phosphorylase [Bacillota bacterium]
MEKWMDGMAHTDEYGSKQVYYLSAEYLMGRALTNNMINLGRYDCYLAAVTELGFDFTEIEDQEADAGLGNGGPGRLAACFLESLATMDLPAVGCGIRYEFGLFRQRILDGEQVEVPDTWTERGYVWEVERSDERYEVHFEGEIEEKWTEQGLKIEHHGYNTVYAVPYDMPIVGYQSNTPATLRLWSAQAVNRLDLSYFNSGDYARAMAERELAEVISKVLYPENTHFQGRLLRLKQFYFLSSASIQSIVARHKKRYGDLRTLPDKIAIQINDTHPTLAIPELMRILLDEEGFGWDEAFDICRRVFNYTNHTIMAEALEKWDEKMFE